MIQVLTGVKVAMTEKCDLTGNIPTCQVSAYVTYGFHGN